MVLTTMILFFLQGCIVIYNVKNESKESISKRNQRWGNYLQNKSRLWGYWVFHDGKKSYTTNLFQVTQDSVKTNLQETDKPFQLISSDKSAFRRIQLKRLEKHSLVFFTNEPLSAEKQTIPVDDIDHIKYLEFAYIPNILLNAAMAVGVTAGIVAIICNCPRVYSHDLKGNRAIHGSILTGAMSKSLEKEDYLVLENMVDSQATIHLSIANELPETEYIDQIKILKVNRTPGSTIGYGMNGSLFEFSGMKAPVEASSPYSGDIREKVQHFDTVSFHFEEGVDNSLSQAIMVFDKPQGEKTIKLVIKGRQGQQLQQTMEYFFRMFGDKFDQYTRWMNNVPGEKFKRSMEEQGISMNVWLKSGEGWEKIGAFENTGTVLTKTMGMDIPLEKIEGDKIEIKLETGFGFWELDQVGITGDWNPLTIQEEVPVLTAINEEGVDVTSLLARRDKNYAVQKDNGSVIDISFPNNARENELFVLQATGYYLHIRDYDNPPERASLRQLKKEEHGFHVLSQQLHEYLSSMAKSNQP